MRFRTKITVCTICLLALLFGIGNGLTAVLTLRAALERESRRVQDEFCMAVDALQLIDADDAGTVLRALAQRSGWDGMRLAEGTHVIVSTGAWGASLEPMSADPAAFCVSITGEGDRRRMQVGGALTVNGTLLTLDIARNIDSLYEERDERLAVCARLTAVLVTLGGIAAWLVARVLTRPLTDMAKASRKLADGQMDARVPVRSADEIGALAADFNTMAEQLADSMDAMRESVEQQERFTGSFAHEMKTPMTSIIGYADLLRGGMLTGEEQADAANYIYTEGQRLENLSRKLLELQMLTNDPPQLIPTDPANLIQGLVAHLRPTLEAQKVRLQCKCQSGCCRMEPELVRTVLVNLIDNARKAMESGGNVMILSEMLPDGCRIRVLDNGRGMPPEALAHLTEAFYRVDKARSRSQGGVGLGLALCDRIVKLHGGTMTFESREGNGTCVTVTLRGGAAE